MTAQIIDGKAVAKAIRESIRQVMQDWPYERPPGLGVIIVGDDPASHIYVNTKKKMCARLGFHSQEITLPADTTEKGVIVAIDALNGDPRIDGILVQLPLPRHIDTNRVLDHVISDKDVDGFHPISIGKLMQGRLSIQPCTPAGVIRLLESIDFEFEGSRAVVIGRSNIVGKPVGLLLLARNMTVTLCHSRTRDLAGEVSRADLVVAAAGVPQLVKGEWIKPGAVVIDVGTNRVNDLLVGDVEFDQAVKRAGFITPVPGGVGPMTIAMLMQNSLELAQQHLSC